MESAVAFGVLNKAVALLVVLSASVEVILCALRKVVVVHKVVTRVVGRVYVYHLHPAEVGFLKQL